MKISGKERALPGENITLNISVLKDVVIKLKLLLSESLKLTRAFNYDLKPIDYNKKEISFETHNFQYKNHLTLGFISDKLENDLEYATIQIEALDIENEVKEMSKFEILILKPQIKVEITPIEKEQNKINITLRKIEENILSYFKGLECEVRDEVSNEKVDFVVEHFTEDEYIDNLDTIPIIFDDETAIKSIIISENKPVKLFIYAKYFDRLGNQYESNKASIILEPIPEEIESNEITTFPIFKTFGFESLPLEEAVV